MIVNRLVLLSSIALSSNSLYGSEPSLDYDRELAVPVSSLAFANKGPRRLVVGFENGPRSLVWELDDSRIITAMRPRGMDTVTSVAISPIADRWVEGGVMGRAFDYTIGVALSYPILRPAVAGRTINAKNGKPAPGSMVSALAFTPDGTKLLLGREDGWVVWYPARHSGKPRQLDSRQFKGGRISDLSVSESGIIAVAGELGVVTVVYGSAKPLRFKIRAQVNSVAVSPTGETVLVGTEEGLAVLKPRDATILRSTEVHNPVVAVASSPIPGLAVFATKQGDWGTFDLTANRVAAVHFSEQANITAIAVSSDGLVATGSQDGSIKVWTLEGEERLRILHIDGTWVANDPDGRFDSGNFHRLANVWWQYNDRKVPIEAFLAQRHQPGLIRSVIRQEPIPELQDVSAVNYSQPQVTIVDVLPDPASRTGVVVQVNVADNVNSHQPLRDSSGQPIPSGAKNLRLARDGVIVGHVDGSLLHPGSAAGTHYVKAQLLGPRATFEAYAFSENGVKSGTARNRHVAQLQPSGSLVSTARGNVYLVSIGVNRYDAPKWNLEFAVNDGRAIQTALTDALSTINKRPIPVTLYSDRDQMEATKRNIRGVFDLLAGRTSVLSGRYQIPAATPNDTIVFTFSGHGYASDAGLFYLFPSDIGTGTADTSALLRRGISSDELTTWIDGIDVAVMVIIIDACHSAGSVEGAGFKPAPLDSPGFGQLAYDKNMIVLAASQASDVALESKLLQQGLLTYALIQEGLAEGQADHAPPDGRIDLREWLQWGVRRVPGLYAAVQAGEVFDSAGTGSSVVLLKAGTRDLIPEERAIESVAQQPVLFDFSAPNRGCPYTIWKGPNAERSWCGVPTAPLIRVPE